MGASAFDQSTTAASNSDIGGVNQAEGCAPSTVNNATRALAAQMKGALIGVTATGTDTYVATLAPAPDALTDGMTVHIRFTNANATTSPTLNINSLGAETIVKEGSAALVAGDIPAGHEGDLRYNGTNWVLLNPKVSSAAALTGSANTFTADQTIQSADGSAGAAPILNLDRNSASPAISDVLGDVRFSGRDSGGGTDVYASIHTKIVDPTATSEDGKVEIDTAVAGSLSTRVTIAQGIQVGSASGGDKGAGTVNATAVYDDGVQLFGPRAVGVASSLSTTPSVTSAFTSIGTVSMSRSSAGVYTLSWSTSLSNVNVQLTGRRSDNGFVDVALGDTLSGTSAKVNALNDASVAFDPTEIHFVIYGT